jgi:hypothetical protein
MTWGRKTGGRKKGTPNKIKKPPALMVEAQAEVAAAVSANEGLQPLDCMLQVMRDPTASEVRPLFFSICYFCLFVGRLATSNYLVGGGSALPDHTAPRRCQPGGRNRNHSLNPIERDSL